jgi:hypothetical protein
LSVSFVAIILFFTKITHQNDKNRINIIFRVIFSVRKGCYLCSNLQIFFIKLLWLLFWQSKLPVMTPLQLL